MRGHRKHVSTCFYFHKEGTDRKLVTMRRDIIVRRVWDASLSSLFPTALALFTEMLLLDSIVIFTWVCLSSGQPYFSQPFQTSLLFLKWKFRKVESDHHLASNNASRTRIWWDSLPGTCNQAALMLIRLVIRMCSNRKASWLFLTCSNKSSSACWSGW